MCALLPLVLLAQETEAWDIRTACYRTAEADFLAALIFYPVYLLVAIIVVARHRRPTQKLRLVPDAPEETKQGRRVGAEGGS